MTSSPVGGAFFGVVLGVVFALSSTSNNRTNKPSSGKTPSSPVVAITDLSEIDQHMNAARPLLLAFTSSGLGGDIDNVHQQFDRAAELMTLAGRGGAAVFAVVDVDKVEEAAQHYAVESVTEVRLYRDGNEVSRWSGIEDGAVYAEAAITSAATTP